METLDGSMLVQLRALSSESGAPLLDELIDCFVEEVPARVGKLRALAEKGSPQDVAVEAHALTGIAGALTAGKLAELTAKIEERCVAGEDILSLLEPLEQEAQAAERALRKWRST